MTTTNVLLCAWMLWSGTLTEPIVWYPLAAFDTHQECRQRIDAIGQLRLGGAVYKCLPDSVDARGRR